ncbi:MAG: hypothetical protein JWQ63_4301 [Mucilaginibacter sp.]|jgi:hypothetical protein|nr:hypothetical protein [Mucilaginibacter sp.]
MKFRITPLNFASAFFLIIAVYSWVYGIKISGVQLQHMDAAIGWIFLLFAVVVSFMDILFRNFFPETKKIWIVELSFITLAAIIFLLVK